MDVIATERFIADYLRGADKECLRQRYGFKSVASVISAKRMQIDRNLDPSYEIKNDERLLPCKDIPFYASNYGNLFNVLRQRIIIRANNHGYARFTSGGVDYLVHRLVCAAFLGESDLQVNHIDGRKTNNHINNLEYCTAKENTKHSIEVLGNLKHGESNGFSKLTDTLVKEIYDLYQPRHKDCGLQALADKYGVDHTTIHLIVNGKMWQHITGGKKKSSVKNPLKLSAEAIEDIRQNYPSRQHTLKYYAEKYDVCVPTVRKVLKQKNGTI